MRQSLICTILPITEPKYPPIETIDAREATAPPRFDLKAPQGAPNVVIVMLDDMGFGQSSAFGGPVQMPTVDKLAKEGLSYNRFHTTALCSPSRAALLSGRNHHSYNMGAITNVATAFPGMTGQRAQDVAPLAEMLRLNGYSTAQFGKSHETAPWEISPVGPFDRWPTSSGMEKFYGFIDGETNHWTPDLYDGTTKIEPPKDPNYNFMTDMTNQAISWVRTQQALAPNKPFFMYFAPGATHAPHHVPKEWIAKYKGKFDGGWDKMREEVLARQKKLGVVPQDTQLAPKPEGIQEWDSLSADEKRLFARQMEVFAGFGEYADTEIGRLVASLEEQKIMDNTMFIYIVGDNGASAEGGAVGLTNEFTFFNGQKEAIEDGLKHIDDLGGPMAYNHYAAGWAVAGDTPFTWAKQVASSFGGTRNPMVIHWPKGFKAKGEVRSQFTHLIDIAPTILEAAHLPEPTMVNGIKQRPIEGVSLAYTFDKTNKEERHKTQYFEIGGNRAIYHDGWVALTIHRAPWEFKPRNSLKDDVWELYNVDEDFSESKDLAKQYPEKLKELQALFLTEAVKYNVLPLDDRSIERFDPVRAGRPDLMNGRKSLTLSQGMPGLNPNAFINLLNTSYSITAEVDAQESANGVIIAQGGRFGGWTLYVKDGKPNFHYNFLRLSRYSIAGSETLPKGKSTVRFEFKYDGGKPGSGGVGTIYINDKKVGEGRIEKTIPNKLIETADVGIDRQTPVFEDYGQDNNAFTGTVSKVTMDLK